MSTKKKYVYYTVSPIRRFIARFLDYLLISIFFLICVLIVNVKDEHSFFAINNSNVHHYLQYLIIGIASFISAFSYFVFFQKYCSGQTVGKKILKIKVIDKNSQKIASIKQIILRELFITLCPAFFTMIISILIYIYKPSGDLDITALEKINFGFSVFISLNYTTLVVLGAYLICLFLNKNGIGLHDILFHTRVVTTTKFIEEDSSEESKEEKDSLFIKAEKIDKILKDKDKDEFNNT